MTMGMTLLLWLLVSALGAFQAAGHEEEVCYGKNFYFRRYYSFEKKTVLFTPKSSPGSARVVLDQGKVLDPRFNFLSSGVNTVRLSEVTHDYEGDYTAGGILGNMTVTLTVKDCSEKCETDYGGTCSWPEKCKESYGGGCSVSDRRVERVDYSPAPDGRDTKVVWRRSKPTEGGRGRLTREGYFEITKCSPKDYGYYTFRDSNGKFLQRYLISIKEPRREHLDVERGEDFRIEFPVDDVPWTLHYFPGNRIRNPIVLMQDGDLYDGGTFEARMELWSTSVVIHKIRLDEEGTFLLLDSDGIRAKLLKMDVLEEYDGGLVPSVLSKILPRNVSPVYFMAAVPIVVVIFMCCCVKRCRRCCKDNPAGRPATQGYIHEIPSNVERHPYSTVVNEPTYRPGTPPPFAPKPQPAASYSQNPPPYTPSVGGDGFLGTSSRYTSTPHGSPMHVQGSAAGGVNAPTINIPRGFDAPTINLPGGFDCLSSGTTFEVPTAPNHSSSLLNSDTPSYDVYTSDKLNFR